jgi:hypothetical protein
MTNYQEGMMGNNENNKEHQEQWQGVGVRPKNIYIYRFVFKE